MTRILAVACVLLVACGDDGAEAPPGDSPGGGGGSAGGGGETSGSNAGGAGGGGAGAGGHGGAPERPVSFVYDLWPILSMARDPAFAGANDSCAGENGCHRTGAGGLVLPDMTTSYGNLLDAPSSSTLCAGKLQVVASQPDESCFVVFYEQRLRDQLAWVDQAETDLVRAWVEEGAAP
jgi:hypothetical protein